MDNSIFQGGQIRDNNAQWVTRLFTGPPKLLEEEPADHTVHVQPQSGLVGRHARHLRRLALDVAVWINPANNPASRSGFEDIKSVNCKGKTGVVTFKKVYADWETLLNGGVWPAKYMGGQGREQAVGGLYFLELLPVLGSSRAGRRAPRSPS